jgi:thioredoxin-like negative regulator of GroEL
MIPVTFTRLHSSFVCHPAGICFSFAQEQLRAIAVQALRTAALLFLAPALLAQDFSQTQTKPAPQTALIDQANDALAKADYPAALKLLTDLNTQLPNDPHILYNLGFTLEALNPQAPNAAAAADYRASILASPSFLDPHVALGLLLARTGNLAEAKTELIAAINLPIPPEAEDAPALKARACRALARIYQHASPPNLPAASDALLAAIKLTPETPDDILFAAELAEAAADLPAAEQAYRRYLALPANTSSPSATAALAHILLAENHPAEADSVLTSALAAHPGDPALTAQLAQTYLSSGDPAKTAQAIPLVQSLHSAHPDDPTITRLLARLYVETGHPDQADPLYAALISTQSQNGSQPDPTLVDDRAEALIRLHRPGEAERILKQATANPAAFPTPQRLGEAATHLAFAAAEIDDPKMTLQALTLRATVLPPSPSTLFLEATANDTLHQNRQAVDLYKKFLAEANGRFPDQESQSRQRLAALQPKK